MVIASKITVDINTQPPRMGNAKAIYCITDGTFFASGLDAALAHNTDNSEISKVCRGKKKYAKGKQYCFVHDMSMHIEDIAAATREAKANTTAELQVQTTKLNTQLSKLNAQNTELTKQIVELTRQNEILLEKQRKVSKIISELNFI
jgi:hypothetical protein